MKIIGTIKEAFRSKMVNYRINKLIEYWDKEKYSKIPDMFKSSKDYNQLKIDSFPFLYFMIGRMANYLGEGKTEPIDIFLKKNKFKN